MTLDRRSAVARSTTVNGVDYARVGADRRTITVFFINPRVNLAEVVTGATLTGGSLPAGVPIRSIAPDDWANGPPITLTLHVEGVPDDSSPYTIALTSDPLEAGGSALDPYFAETPVSFLAGRAWAVDCEVPPAPAAPAASGPPIDYLSKDFASFRNALLAFSALRYPSWQERSEADFGVMYLEALSSLADDLSYQQDRIAAEAHIDTASERRSLVRLARLVGYEPQPALSATTALQLTVSAGTTAIPAGLAVYAGAADGTSIPFETGQGLADSASYPASASWNAMTPYVWDPANPVLEVGATEIWVLDPLGAIASSLPAGASLLISNASAAPSQQSFAQIVVVASVESAIDPLYDTQLAHIVWSYPGALTRACVLTETSISGNIVPATQGLRYVESFAIGAGPSGVPLAIGRTGPNRTAQYLYTLGEPQLAWLASAADPETPFVPEIQLSASPPGAGTPSSPPSTSAPWTWMRWLLDAQPFDTAFTVDPMSYVPVHVEIPAGATNDDYDGSGGWTVRFGDGTFGEIPATGTLFHVLYRAGGGAMGNVAAGAITTIAPASPIAALASAVTNPLAATGGADAQTADSIRKLAPQSYKNGQLTAVLPGDFSAAAETLDWVARAGSTSRFTGSWLTMFTTAQPRAAPAPTATQAAALRRLIDRRSIAGRDSAIPVPSYVALDLRVVVGARPDAFRSAVEASVSQALASGRSGFFSDGNFTFGEPLTRSALESAIQAAPGVAGVVDLLYRRAGSGGSFTELPAQISVGAAAVIQVENDPRRPLAGSVQVTVQGGK